MWDTRIQEAQKVQWTVEHFLQKERDGLVHGHGGVGENAILFE